MMSPAREERSKRGQWLCWEAERLWRLTHSGHTQVVRGVLPPEAYQQTYTGYQNHVARCSADAALEVAPCVRPLCYSAPTRPGPLGSHLAALVASGTVGVLGDFAISTYDRRARRDPVG